MFAVSAIDAPPPGRPLHLLDVEDQRLVLIGLEGLAARLRSEAAGFRAGSRGYHDLGRWIGRVVTISEQLRRHLAACEGAESDGEGQED